MNESFKIASILLTYPDAAFSQFLEEAREASVALGNASARAAIDALQAVPLEALVRCYVSTFDMQESTALYVTAHELGDSRERGGALLKMHALLRSAALEPIHGELPDYVPLLLEFLAEKPVGMPTEELESRLAVVCRAIRDRLEPNHPYRPVFDFIDTCFASAGADSQTVNPLAQIPQQDADVDNLPYPLVYD